MRPALVALACAACGGHEDAAPVPATSIAAPDPAVAAGPACDPATKELCVGDDLVECRANGTLGRTVRACRTGCAHDACVSSCAVNGVELVYVVDTAGELLSFDPKKLPGDPFQLVGKLQCDRTSRPFSMAVDRQGIAWVVYEDARVFRVSIVDAHCAATSSVPDGGTAATYGMGFVTDGAKATTEKLYVAANDDSHAFAYLDLSADRPRWIPVGTIEANQQHNPELTGTSEGKLFGYFPEAGHGFVQEIDRTSGKMVGARQDVTVSSSDVEAYAFAQWGGVFYLFTTADGESSVHAIHRKTGKVEVVRAHSPYRIVGAGVSTCAPELERDLGHP